MTKTTTRATSLTTTRSNFMAKMIEQSNGKFFNCLFVKQDGSIRQMTARTGVVKHLKGAKKTTDSAKYLTVFEPSSGKYKSINRNTILELSISGVKVG